MALRDKLKQRAQQYLEPGEQVQAVFLAQTGLTPWLMLVTSLFAFFFKFRVVVVTDRRILVLASSFWTPAKPRSIDSTLPRQTRIGPVSGLWAKVTSLGGVYYIHTRFHKDVRAADAAIGAA